MRVERANNKFRQAIEWLYSFPPGSDHDIRFQITVWLHYSRASFTPAGFENIQSPRNHGLLPAQQTPVSNEEGKLIHFDGPADGDEGGAWVGWKT